MSELKAVILQCGNEEYAISVDSIVSIERLEKINRIPHLPEYMLGLMKIRGELVPILDLEQILYLRPAGESEQVRIIVVQTETLTIGLLVLDAKEILDIPENVMTSSGLLAYSKTPYFTTVANLENRMITVIDPDVLSQSLARLDDIEEYIEEQKSIELNS